MIGVDAYVTVIAPSFPRSSSWLPCWYLPPILSSYTPELSRIPSIIQLDHLREWLRPYIILSLAPQYFATIPKSRIDSNGLLPVAHTAKSRRAHAETQVGSTTDISEWWLFCCCWRRIDYNARRASHQIDYCVSFFWSVRLRYGR